MTTHALLDRIGDGVVPDGFKMVDSEVDFLRIVADPNALLFIRGERLSAWASAYYDGRRLAYTEARSPYLILKAHVPGITTEQASAITSHLSDVSLLYEDLSLSSLLEGLFPHRMWRRGASRQHAAEWLLWLQDAKPEPWVSPLLEAIASQWRNATPISEQAPYEATNANDAALVLDGWLGIAETRRYTALGRFPGEVPSTNRERARTSWHKRMIESQGLFLEVLRTWNLPDMLIQDAASLAYSYYKSNPGNLGASTFDFLSRYLSPWQVTELRSLLRPEAPGQLPETPTDVITWFRHEYLPLRLWQSRNEDATALEEVRASARAFAMWYLREYPAGLVGGPLGKYFSFSASRDVARDTRGATILLIVLDGLHVADAQTLQMKIQQRVPRLLTTMDSLVFAPLPTITEFCKEALLRGVAPKYAGDQPTLGRVLPESISPAPALTECRPGEIYIWRVLEPDRTYHQRNTYESLPRQIEAQLSAEVENIAAIVERVPSEISLQIVIATDHGRLLARSDRAISPPPNMEIHSRTASGNTGFSFPACGYEVHDGVAFLHGERFGLLTDVAVVLTEGAFLGADGRSGHELYPHGGLYPEEVLVPWIVLERDAVSPDLSAHVAGNGRTGKPGNVCLAVTNLASIRVILRSLELQTATGVESIMIDQDLHELSTLEIKLALKKWPSASEAREMSGILRIEMPNGRKSELTIDTMIESDELYHQENILEGLDL